MQYVFILKFIIFFKRKENNRVYSVLIFLLRLLQKEAENDLSAQYRLMCHFRV